jgi:hypothetical protein
MNCCRETTLDGRATWQPQGVGSEAYLNGTSQGPTSEDARKDDRIRGRSKLFMKYPGLTSPDDIYGYCHNSGQGQQEKAIGEIQEHEVPYTKTKAVNSGSAESPIDACSSKMWVPA